MVGRTIAFFAGILCCSMGMLLAQTVEKTSASFTFPLTITSTSDGGMSPRTTSYFKQVPQSIGHGKFALEWNISTSARSGSISLYSVSGKLVKKIALNNTAGIMECDLGKTAAGVYCASISYGSYRQNLKLALYR
jgi:hypothetical protein